MNLLLYNNNLLSKLDVWLVKSWSFDELIWFWFINKVYFNQK